ncbi:hypothetical protein AB0L82_41000 [Nocardia sp. NPDC052001]|uniref:hypothetical protein n=1 Tax=Nocardia sp. NPDC052001 TaxID=3154853 RepID=UPI00343F777A
MVPPVDKAKIDDIVKQMKNDCDSHSGAMPWNWGSDPWGFTDKQAADAAEKLNKMNSEEFAYAWSQMDYKSDNGYYNLKTSLFNKVPKEIRDDPKYADLLTSVQHDYPKTVIDAKKKAEDDADKPVFAKHDPATGVPDFGKHIVEVVLTAPDGASAQLEALVQDTEFTMQWDLDSLGLHTPKTAPPEFSPVLVADERYTTVSGWSDIRAAHETLKGKLDARQTEYNGQHKIATDATFDTEIKGKALFTDLVGMVGEAQKLLGKTLDGWTRDGDKLVKKINHPHDEPTTQVLFERNTSKNELYKTPEADNNKFFLTPEAEQEYYVKPLKDLVLRWDKKYAEAAKEFLKDAEKLPAPPDTPTPPRPPAPGPTPGPTPGPPPAATPSPGPAVTPGPATPQNTDYSALFKDALANSPDGQATTPPGADGATPPGTQGTQPGTTSTDTNNNQQALDAIDAAENRVRQNDSVTPAVYNPGTNAGGYSGGGNGGGNSGGGSSFDPSQLMMMSALQQAMQNRDKGNGGMQDDRGEPRRPRDPNAVNPAANTPGAPTAPGAPGAPGQPVVTADQTTPPPTNAKGLVNVTIPGLNGTQQVSTVVQDALTKAFSNPAGCDARAAYDGGPGQSTPGMPWKQISDAELRTGDIAQWGNRTALVVMTDNGPQIILDGKLGPMQDGHLVQFNPNNLPDSLGGEFGKFEGFFHPTGADLSTDGQAPPQTKPEDPPKVAAPAAPGVVPAATPPTRPSGEI